MESRFTDAQINALKRRATRLQRQQSNLSRSEALDRVAQDQGFRNWSLLARNRSSNNEAAPKPYTVVLRAIVRGREPGASTKWWDDNVPANHPEKYYEKFKWMPVYLTANASNEAGARQQLATMRRVVEFMDATELRPSKAWARLFGKHHGKPEGLDHTSVWHDGKKRYAVTTEPYIGRDAVADIRAWCEKHGWRIAVAPNGRGIWNPCLLGCPSDCTVHTQMVVLSPQINGVDPDAIVAALK